MQQTAMSRFKVKPGKTINLKQTDPNPHLPNVSKRHTAPHLRLALARMDKLQAQMWAERKHSLLIVLQGRDAAGKDGVIRHVITGMNPQGCSVSSFKQPTAEELAHDFLWRVHVRVPERGTVAIFNRSHYEDVLAARVHRLVPRKVWKARYREINDFEHMLWRDNNTTILKFFLHISKKEQLARFGERLNDPSHNWKISESDYTDRQYWSEYDKAFEEMFHETSKRHAPWFIIPANQKWFCHLAISELLVQAMTDMAIKTPKPSVDLNEIRHEYHTAAMKR